MLLPHVIAIYCWDRSLKKTNTNIVFGAGRKVRRSTKSLGFISSSADHECLYKSSRQSVAKNNSRIKAEQIFFLMTLFYHWWVHVPPPPPPPPLYGPLWPFINSVSWDNRLHLFLGITVTGSPSENSSPPKGCLYLPSILAGLYYSLSACLHSWCQVRTDASSFPLSNASHFSVFFSFLFFCIIIICPERALSEGGLFVLQPGSQLFSGSAVFFSSPSVQFEYPWEIWLCLWYLFCPADQFLFLLISLQPAKILSLILISNCLQSDFSVVLYERYAIIILIKKMYIKSFFFTLFLFRIYH